MIPAYPGSVDYPDRTPEEIKADLEREAKEQQKFNAHMLVKTFSLSDRTYFSTPPPVNRDTFNIKNRLFADFYWLINEQRISCLGEGTFIKKANNIGREFFNNKAT